MRGTAWVLLIGLGLLGADTRAGGPSGEVPVVVRDLATGKLLPDFALRVTVNRPRGGVSVLARETDQDGVLSVPDRGIRRFAALGDWRIPRDDARAVLADRELWVCLSLRVEGRVVAAEGLPLNPTGVTLSASFLSEGPPTPRRRALDALGGFRRLPPPRMDGAYLVRVPAVQNAVLVASAPGFVAEVARLPVAPASGRPARVDFALRAAPRVAGVVRLEDGTPVADHPLTLYVTDAMTPEEYRRRGFARIPGHGFSYRGMSGRAVVGRGWQIRTDDRGRFEARVTVPGAVTVFVPPVAGTGYRLEPLGRLVRDASDLDLALPALAPDPRVAVTRKGAPLLRRSLIVTPLSGDERPRIEIQLDGGGAFPAAFLRPGTRYRIQLEELRRIGGVLTWTGKERRLDLDDLAEREKEEGR